MGSKQKGASAGKANRPGKAKPAKSAEEAELEMGDEESSVEPRSSGKGSKRRSHDDDDDWDDRFGDS